MKKILLITLLSLTSLSSFAFSGQDEIAFVANERVTSLIESTEAGLGMTCELHNNNFVEAGFSSTKIRLTCVNRDTQSETFGEIKSLTVKFKARDIEGNAIVLTID